MVTLEQLKREKARLLAVQQAREDIKRIGRERSQLKAEIKSLRNPKTFTFKRNLKKGILSGGRSILKIIDDATRPEPIRRKSIKPRTIKSKKRKRK